MNEFSPGGKANGLPVLGPLQVTRAIVYSRVSTDAQERDGTSLDTQERECLAHARGVGWQVIECIRDTASGSTLDRPGIEQLRAILRNGGADMVLSYAVDRLSRNQNQIGVLFDEVEQAGAHLEFVTEKFEDTAVGRLILSVRAFSAEVEREKIAERTMRGKAERARSGRLPQGTGKGCYGYVYNRETGRREVDHYQAVIVQRIFQRYAESRSFSAVSNELNQAGVPAFSGGRWYPPTVRRILTNESYAGRFVYRRTRRVKARNSNNNGHHTKVILRPTSEWIEVDGGSPRIIDEPLWQRVQEILNDPERTRRRTTNRFYLLRSRARCGVCRSAMVGQTLTVKGRPFSYYRCRHAYTNITGHRCSARYVRANMLEEAVWAEIKQVLADPGIVLQELEKQSEAIVDEDEVAGLEEEVASLVERERRLVRLYTFGTVDEQVIRTETEDISRRRSVLEQQLSSMKRPQPTAAWGVDPDRLKSACDAVVAWLDKADTAERTLALEALQVNVEATKEAATVTGVLPTEPPAFIADEHTSRCLFNGD